MSYYQHFNSWGSQNELRSQEKKIVSASQVILGSSKLELWAYLLRDQIPDWAFEPKPWLDPAQPQSLAQKKSEMRGLKKNGL